MADPTDPPLTACACAHPGTSIVQHVIHKPHSLIFSSAVLIIILFLRDAVDGKFDPVMMAASLGSIGDVWDCAEILFFKL